MTIVATARKLLGMCHDAGRRRASSGPPAFVVYDVKRNPDGSEEIVRSGRFPGDVGSRNGGSPLKAYVGVNVDAV